jgi:hypothetical protein
MDSADFSLNLCWVLVSLRLANDVCGDLNSKRDRKAPSMMTPSNRLSDFGFPTQLPQVCQTLLQKATLGRLARYNYRKAMYDRMQQKPKTAITNESAIMKTMSEEMLHTRPK